MLSPISLALSKSTLFLPDPQRPFRTPLHLSPSRTRLFSVARAVSQAQLFASLDPRHFIALGFDARLAAHHIRHTLLAPMVIHTIPATSTTWCTTVARAPIAVSACQNHIDCACKRHSLCYRRNGAFNCKCDIEMLRDLKAAHQFSAIRVFSQYLTKSPCRGPVVKKFRRLCRKCRFGMCWKRRCGSYNKCHFGWIGSCQKRKVKKYVCWGVA